MSNPWGRHVGMHGAADMGADRGGRWERRAMRGADRGAIERADRAGAHFVAFYTILQHFITFYTFVINCYVI